MSLKEYLYNCNGDVNRVTELLLMLDKSIMELHQYGYFVVGDLGQIKVINNQITLDSFQNKVDYLNSGFNENGDKKDILEMCVLGICAYNHIHTFYVNDEFLEYLRKNIKQLLNKDVVPQVMVEYYLDVFQNVNIDYLNNFLLKKSGALKGNSNVRSYTKSTAVGRALADKDQAFVDILLLPSILVFIYLLFITIYFLSRLFEIL